MSKWVVKSADVDQTQTIANHFSLPQGLAHVLVSRGYDTVDKVNQFLDLSLAHLISPFDLSNMEEACQWIISAIENKKKILIHGDFDADGITSSALFYLFFQELDVDVEVFIPNRLEEGHGISQRAIQNAISQGVSLFITCDCGSSSHLAIEQLLTHGIQVIVTDHHHVGDPLPKGALLVNPKQISNQSDMEELSGVGVVFLCLMALRKNLRDLGFFAQKNEPNLKAYLDIVALGTIADLAPIMGMNRILVSQGLEIMQYQSRVGIAALKEAVGLTNNEKMISEDVGFKLAPKINAAARLGASNVAFELLVCQDPIKAQIYAQQLLSFNEKRKKLQDQMWVQAMAEVQRQNQMGFSVLVVASPDFHPGIVGLLAQKICQETQKPTFAFTFEDQWAKGSARSPMGVNLIALMQEMASMFIEFGGHEQAGGGKILQSNLQNFTLGMQKAFQKIFGDLPSLPREVDAPLGLPEINEVFFDCLHRLRPFGMGYPSPIFEVKGVCSKPFEVGKNHLKCKVEDSFGRSLDAIAFDRFRLWKDRIQGPKALLVSPQRQVFRGKAQISLQLLDFE